MTQAQEAVSTINGLIETLKDGEKGFKEASKAVSDPHLKSPFEQYSQQRHRFAHELQAQSQSLGELKPKKMDPSGRSNASSLDQLEVHRDQRRRQSDPDGV